MTTDSQKKSEIEILELVYEIGKGDSVVISERPDFKITRQHAVHSFGVEVTEFFYSESDARIRKIDGYLDELIDTGEYRHKDDIDVLEIADITITDPESGETKYGGKAIFRSLAAPGEFVDRIVDTIEDKGRHYQSLSNDLSHVNLVIRDNESRFLSWNAEQFYNAVLTPRLKKVLFGSPFREVFFVTRVEQERRVYFPLKMVAFVSEAMLLNRAAVKYDSSWEKLSFNQDLEVLSRHLSRYGAVSKIGPCDTGYNQLYHGDTSFSLGESSMVIRMHNDSLWPEEELWDAAESWDELLTESFYKHFREYEANSRFDFHMLIDARG